MKPGVHKAVIDELTAIQEAKKEIARKVVAELDFGVILFSTAEARLVQRKRLIRRFLLESRPLFTATHKLGLRFAEQKLAS